MELVHREERLLARQPWGGRGVRGVIVRKREPEWG